MKRKSEEWRGQRLDKIRKRMEEIRQGEER
jgi:hypothetical protein